jgi:hypothetical protein
MRLHDRATEIAVFGLVGGTSGAALGLLWRLGFSADNLFALGGAVIGAAATVAGAVWLTDRNAALSRNQEISIIAKECKALLSKTREVSALRTDDGEWSAEYRAGLHELNAASVEVPAILDEALAHGKALDFRQRVKIKNAEKSIREMRNFYEYVFGQYDEDPLDERSWFATFAFVDEALTELLAALEK